MIMFWVITNFRFLKYARSRFRLRIFFNLLYAFGIMSAVCCLIGTPMFLWPMIFTPIR